MIINEEDYKNIIKRTPLVSIDIIVTDLKGNVLLGYRKFKPAKETWFVPGGRIRLEEKPIEKAFSIIVKRELDIDYDIKKAVFMGYYEHDHPDNFSDDTSFGTYFVVLAFEIRLNKTININDLPTKYHSKWDWFDIEGLLKNNEVHEFVKEFFRKKSIPIEPIYYNSRMINYLHFDQQMWSRIKTLLIVEGASLTAGYHFLKSKNSISSLIMIISIVLLLIIRGLIKRDQENRDNNLPFFDEVRYRVNLHYAIKLPTLLLDAPTWRKGSTLLNYFTIPVLIITNGILAYLFYKYPCLFK